MIEHTRILPPIVDTLQQFALLWRYVITFSEVNLSQNHLKQLSNHGAR
jgi:hypothetical protein